MQGKRSFCSTFELCLCGSKGRVRQLCVHCSSPGFKNKSLGWKLNFASIHFHSSIQYFPLVACAERTHIGFGLFLPLPNRDIACFLSHSIKIQA